MAKCFQRKAFDIDSILETVAQQEKEKIINKAVGDQQNSFTKATLNYFQMLIKDARCSFCSKIEGAQLLYKIFGKKLEEIEFQLWLVSALKLNDINELVQFLSYSKEQSSAITSTQGHKLLTLSERESAYNFWKINSEISVHQSNGRHFNEYFRRKYIDSCC